jgi:hypothetical protein
VKKKTKPKHRKNLVQMLHTPPPTHQEGGSTNYNSSKKMNSEVTTNNKARVRRGWVASI